MGMVASIYAKLFGKPNAGGAIYDFSLKDIQGREIHFEEYRGRKLLIVNTASRCGFTPQYADLEKLHRTYSDKITVLGFPSNNFMWQDPASNEDIYTFCKQNYGVTFKMFSKISVRGRTKHPLYRWLYAQTGKLPTWNFCKYIVSEDGRRVSFFSSKVGPMDPAIIGEISDVKL